MTTFISAVSLPLTDFTAHDLPTNKWLRWICPKMRLRVRTRDCDFVSPSVKVDDWTPDGSNFAPVTWPWGDDERPVLTDHERFEIQVERRFLLRYKCIRRTKRTTIAQICTDYDCEVPLHDGQTPVETLQDRPQLGQVTFRLQKNASREDASSTVIPSIYSEWVGPRHKEQRQRQRGF